MTAEKRLYLVDAHAYLHRAYHALPPLTTKAGEPVGALYGFARMLLLLLKRDKPDLLAVCFDTPEPTFRHKAYKEYKATRKEIDEDLKKQLALAHEMVQAMGLPSAEAPGYEADDLMATLARKAVGEGLRVVLVSGDKDALQLVDDRIQVLNEAKGELLDSRKVAEKFKVEPGQIVDYLALLGDSSDNVPGVPGIGAVGAAKLLGRFGSLEKLLAAARKGHPEIPPKAAKALVDNEAAALQGRELVTLDQKAPVALKPGECVPEFKPTDRLVALFQRFEFRTLLKELGAPELQAPGRAPAAESFRFKETDPKEWLKAARSAREVGLAAAKPEQPDLLHSAAPMVALALPDGRAATFADEAFARHKKELAGLLADPKVAKRTHDLKAVLRVLGSAGLRLEGAADDAMLAAYCLDPGRPRYDLAALLKDRGEADLPAEEPGKALARRAACAGALAGGLLEELKAKGLGGLYRDLELPLAEILAGMEEAGVALDEPYLRKVGVEFDEKIAQLKAEIDALAGVEINLNSPKQLAGLLFETLGLPVVHKTPKGGPSTDEETLRVLASKHPIPAKIIDFRELAKLKSTYVEGLLAKVDPDGRVRSSFNQTGTVTGRLSSEDPNLQNIPIRTPHGRKIRRAFVAGKGNVLVAADYSQIDLRVLAHLSGDPALRAAFSDGTDVHTKTAAEVFDVPPDRVDARMRRAAKAVNFGIVYGQTPHGLSQALGIPFGEARDYIRRYFARYRGVEAWIQENLSRAKREGFVKTLLGRVRHLPDLHSGNFQVRSFNERAACNTPIQGTSADIIKAAMINVHRGLAREGFGARLVLQVHDELIFEAPEKRAREFGAWVRREMEGAVSLDVPVAVDVQWGPNWDALEDGDV